MMLLDAHTHAFPEDVCRHREDIFADEPAFRVLYSDPKSRLVTPEELVQMLAEEEVEAAMVSGFPWRQERLWRRQHEVILEAMQRWPRKIIGLCNVNPLDRSAAREVESAAWPAGLRGAGNWPGMWTIPGTTWNKLGAPGGAFPALPGATPPPHERPGGAGLPGESRHSPGRGLPPDPEISGDHLDPGPLGRGLPFYGLLKKEAPEVFRRVYFDTASP